jgi:hypothetical protein
MFKKTKEVRKTAKKSKEGVKKSRNEDEKGRHIQQAAHRLERPRLRSIAGAIQSPKWLPRCHHFSQGEFRAPSLRRSHRSRVAAMV